jgi:hypothetical protein
VGSLPSWPGRSLPLWQSEVLPFARFLHLALLLHGHPYPEFLKRAAASGVAAYCAFLTGKRVVYWGRKGEIHIEEFPRDGRRD